MRKFTLGCFPDMGVSEARREAAAVLSRIWAGDNPAPARGPPAALRRLRRPLSRAPQAPVDNILARNLRCLHA